MIILTVWGVILIIVLLTAYLKRRRYFWQLNHTLDNLDKRYLIAETMDESFQLEDKLYREVLRRSNKSVIEEIKTLNQELKDYKEYIEGWIHEVKAPLSTLTLMCENEKNEFTRKLIPEIGMVDNYVEMALFYARSDSVYKDYFMGEVLLTELIDEVLQKNKLLLIQNRMSFSVDCGEITVISDRKWIVFILTQIVLNAVKYKKSKSGKVRFAAKEKKNNVILTVKDEGIGIKESELPRIFKKGFTGTNGRDTAKSTGIGLYLCKKLSGKLGITISADSKELEYTEITLTFPKSSYLSKL